MSARAVSYVLLVSPAALSLRIGHGGLLRAPHPRLMWTGGQGPRAPPLRAPAPLAASADRLAQPSTSSLLADDGSPAAAEHADLARRAYTGALAAALAGWAYFAVATVAPSAPAARLPQLLALAAPMGVVWASYDAMINAARIGRRRLRLPTYRRLNLGLAASHAWAAVAVAAAPTSPAAAAVQASLLGGCALVCTYVWLWTLSSRTLSRVRPTTTALSLHSPLLPSPRLPPPHPDPPLPRCSARTATPHRHRPRHSHGTLWSDASAGWRRPHQRLLWVRLSARAAQRGAAFSETRPRRVLDTS